MRDEKEERKKQARSNKQTRQSNTAHPRQSLFLEKMSCLTCTCTCMQSAIEAFCNMNTFVCICPLALLRKNQRVVQNYYLRYLGGYDAQLMRDVVMVRV